MENFSFFFNYKVVWVSSSGLSELEIHQFKPFFFLLKKLLLLWWICLYMWLGVSCLPLSIYFLSWALCVCICVSYAVECMGMCVWHVHVCICKCMCILRYLCMCWGVNLCMYVLRYLYVLRCVSCMHLSVQVCVCGTCMYWGVCMCCCVCVWHSCEVLMYMYMWKAEQDTECCPLLPSALLPWDMVFHWTRSSPFSSQDLRISSQHWCYRYIWPHPDFKGVLGIRTHVEEVLLPPELALQPQYILITLHIE